MLRLQGKIAGYKNIARNLTTLPSITSGKIVQSHAKFIPSCVQILRYCDDTRGKSATVASKTSDACKPKPPNPPPPPPPPPPESNNNMLYALIAALGMGGLGFYLMNQQQAIQSEAQVKVCPVTEKYPPYDDPPVDIHCKKEVCNKPRAGQSNDESMNLRPDTSTRPFEDKEEKKDWQSCPEMPSHAPYLIIGAGTAAMAAYRAIRDNDPKAKVLLIGEECNLPYMRPPLTKEMWHNTSHKLTEQLVFKQWSGKERSLFYEKDCFYLTPKELDKSECGGVAVALGRRVKTLDVDCNKVILDNNWEITYDKVLIATGGKPRQHPVISKASPEVQKRTILFRKIVDFQKLDCLTNKGKSVAIIGGGFLGSELAIALGNRSKRTRANVYQIFSEKGNIGKVLPEYLAKWTTAKVRKEGVTVIPEVSVKCAKMCGEKISLSLSNGQEVLVDNIVVSIGLEPEVSIAECAGLETDSNQGGFLVNAEMKARDNVWVAGDAASFYDVKLGRRRVEHHDHAVVSGRLAGYNMTGKGQPYWHQSMIWSDLGPELGFEAIGLVDSSLPTTAIFAKACPADTPKAVVEETGENLRSETETDACVDSRRDKNKLPSQVKGDEEFGKGIIFYMKEKVIVGMVMWNVFNKMPIARKILREQKEHEDLGEVAKLFELHSMDTDKKE